MIARPDRYSNTVVPHIYVDDASKAIDFYKQAFGAVELFRIAYPNGKILHAEISIQGSVVMIGDPDNKLYGEPRALGRTSASLHIIVNDNEALFRHALQAGAQQIQPPTNMFYGANSASLRDPSAMSGCSYHGGRTSSRLRWNVVEMPCLANNQCQGGARRVERDAVIRLSVTFFPSSRNS